MPVAERTITGAVAAVAVKMFWAEVTREVPVAIPITGVVKVGLTCITNVVPVPV